MLTCDDFRDRLPGIAAGEATDEPLREHLAACGTCRERRDRLADEVGLLREGLAALSPSPPWEDAVLRAAREEPVEAPSPRRALWIGAGLAAAAVALVFALVPGRPGAKTPAIAPTAGAPGAATVSIPPSADEVAAAREKNRVSLDHAEDLGGTILHEAAGERHEASATFLPPWEGVAQRWAYGDRDAQAGPRSYSVGALPRDGVMLLGNALLAEIGATVVNDPAEGLTVRVGDRVWRAFGTSSEAEVVVGSPEPGGAEARVRVLISTGYGGTLLLEGPLARALGLNQFEIPGGFTTEGGSVLHGQRARARVRIPELAFDRVVEVQVRDDATSETAVTRIVGDRLSNAAVVPPGVASDAQIGTPGPPPVEGGSAGFVSDLRGHALACRFRDGSVAWTRCFGKRLDVPPEDQRFATVTLADRFEPGAAFTVARVWRGTTAIPSREPVVSGHAGADGVISFPRAAGEAGDTLRMLLRLRDGTTEFREVSIEDAATALRIDIGVRAGTIQFGWSDPGGGLASIRVQGWTFSDTDAAANADLLAKIRSAMVDVVKQAGGPDRARTARIVLEPDATTPWVWITWLMQEAAMPDVAVRRFTFRIAGSDASIDQDLPEDRAGVERASPPTPGSSLRVTFFHRAEESVTRIRVGSPETPEIRLEPGWKAALDQAASTALADAPEPKTAEIAVPPPYGQGVTYGEVFDAMRVLREAGATEFRFEGSELPKR